MSDTTPTLTAAKRERTGSRYSRRLRESGSLPAVVYGHKEEPVSIALDMHETMLHLKKGEKLFELDLEGTKQHVLLKDLGYDYLGTNIIHADFSRVDLNERVDTRAHLTFVGEAVGLKTSGAIMMHPINDIELNVLISNLPDHIDVDVSEMEVGDVLHASDVKLPLESMKLLTDPDTIIAQIVMKAVQEDDTDESGEVSAEGASPEVIGEKPDAE
jgi:large subunit ribosomal protein L25|tara:strand:+ start:1703 stop:2347 length:645 start_codon:yes stop_codon:yes gene_type:complete